MQCLDRQSEAVLAGVLIFADFDDGDIRLIFPVFIYESCNIRDGAGKIKSPAFIRGKSDFSPGKDRIGHDSILETFFQIRDGTLKQNMNHFNERQ
jgi:hypothetical protein